MFCKSGLEVDQNDRGCAFKKPSMCIFSFLLCSFLVVGSLLGGGARAQAQDKKLFDFVICIDNSASIKGQEQTIIRETIMLLADLADKGDRISIITFGREAQTVATATIENDNDRVNFKKQALQGITFKENLSDLGAAFREMAMKKDELFRPSEAISTVIFLSDGKLEPEDRRPQAGLNDIKDITSKSLKDVGFYAVVLGNSSCNDPIPRIPNLNGLQLMRDYIAKTPDRFKHAVMLDQLFKIVLNIINGTKGISAFSEKNKSRFLLDDTVKTMCLIVRKKGADGTPVCTSRDIELKHAVGDPGRPDKIFSTANYMNRKLLEGSAESIYWSNEYQYFDFIRVRRPRGGHWTVELANGRKPEVLYKISSPVQLRFNSRKIYYPGERAFLSAWIYNKDTDAVDTSRTFKIEARLAVASLPGQSGYYLELHPGDKGIYSIEVPKELRGNLLKGKTLPVSVNVELIARAYENKARSEMDPWFVRRSPEIAFQVASPFVHWTPVPERLLSMPLLGGLARKITGIHQVAHNLVLGARLDINKAQAPHFDLPPVLHLKLERLDEKGKAVQTIAKELNGKSEGNLKAVYAWSPEGALRPGSYRVSYQLSGTRSDGGIFNMEGPSSSFRVISYTWVLYACAFLLMLVLLQTLSPLTAKPRGKIVINGRMTQPPGRRSFPVDGCFELTAVRILFLFKWISIKSLTNDLKVNGQNLPMGQSRKLPCRRQHQVVRGSDKYTFLLVI